MRIQLSAPSTANRTLRHRLGALVAVLFCVGGGIGGLAIALTGARVGGGLWLLPDATNQMVGRVFFGVRGLLCFAIAALAARDVRAVPATHPTKVSVGD